MKKINRKKQKRRLIVLGTLILAALLLTHGGTYAYAVSRTKQEIDKNIEEIKAQKKEKRVKREEDKENDRAQQASFRLDEELMKDIKHVMIVAHPDDETLWAGNHLLNEHYLVVCITNGDHKTRRAEFEKAMKITKDYGVILNYPDNPNHVKNDWAKVKESIRKDIDYILNYKEYDTINTHNPEGEYGHIQHRFTSFMVTENCVKNERTDKLYYFGKYYEKKELHLNVKNALLPEQANEKEKLMGTVYKSQGYAHRIFDHMVPYEKFIAHDDWTFRRQK